MIRSYFHRMGHVVCESCDWQGATKSALIHHLREHREAGDAVPSGQIEALEVCREKMWDLAISEGKR